MTQNADSDGDCEQDYVMAGVVLVLIATVAAWIPARRATNSDPMGALRAE